MSRLMKTLIKLEQTTLSLLAIHMNLETSLQYLPIQDYIPRLMFQHLRSLLLLVYFPFNYEKP